MRLLRNILRVLFEDLKTAGVIIKNNVLTENYACKGHFQNIFSELSIAEQGLIT